MHIPYGNACHVVNLIAEGNTIGSTARIVGSHEHTIGLLLATVGRGCSNSLRSRVRNVDVGHLEVDGVWKFLREKQRRVTANDP